VGQQLKRARIVLTFGAALVLAAVFGAVAVADTAPTTTVDAPTEIGYVTAQLGGTVNPNGGPSTTCWRFEFLRKAQMEAGEESWEWANFNCFEENEDSTKSDPLPVAVDLGGLSPGTVYLVRLTASNEGGENTTSVVEFETDQASLPTATIDPAGSITATGAHFSGTVDPNAPKAASELEGGSPEEEEVRNVFRTSWHFECEPSCGAPSADPVEADNQAHEVSVDAPGLEPNTTYKVRLVAESAAGRAESAPEEFTTDLVAPTVAPEVSTPSGTGEMTIRGFVSPPNPALTDCHFVYGLTAAYGETAPCSDQQSAAGQPVRVSAELSGLTPGATYHYRLFVTNAVDSASGEDGIFHSPAAPVPESCLNDDKPGASFLPDCRAYEMVSPAIKKGADVLVDTSRTQVATDGTAVTFASLTGFGDVVGGGVATEYMSLRRGASASDGNGWTSHAITPPQDPLGINAVLSADPLYMGDLADDLSRGVFKAWSPVTDAPAVAATANLYLRDDLRTPGVGSYQLLTPCLLCELQNAPLPPLRDSGDLPRIGGASEDFQHVAIESRSNLTVDAPLQPDSCSERSSGCAPRVYEWWDGQLRLAGLVPPESDISCGGGGPACVPAHAAILGAGLQQMRPINVISDDGARIIFTLPADGSGAVSPNTPRGKLYLRKDGETTEEISASERTDCAGDPTCGGDGIADPAPGEFAPAQYWGASADGLRVFFTSGQPLTDNARGGDRGLYMYDAAKPASEPHNLTLLNVDAEPRDAANDVEVVFAVSDNGKYVYFISSGQLVPGEPLISQGRGIFAWHDGELAYVGETTGSVNENMLTGAIYATQTQARVSPDGAHFLLSVRSGSGLASGLNHGSCPDGCRELYLYSADTHELVCASCGAAGRPPQSDAITTARAQASGATTNWHLSQTITADNRRIFFTTGEALVDADTNGTYDAYEYDIGAAAVHLVSSGTDPFDSYFMETTPSGGDVVFSTREQLVGWDSDASRDVYDARVGGGFAEPPPAPVPCAGGVCQGTPPPPPAAVDPGSASLEGATNRHHKRPHRSQRKRCGKHKHRVRRGGVVRCVKSSGKKNHKPRARSANFEGRAPK